MTLRDSSRQWPKNFPYEFAQILHGLAPLPEAFADKCPSYLAKILEDFARNPQAFPKAVAQDRPPGIDQYIRKSCTTSRRLARALSQAVAP